MSAKRLITVSLVLLVSACTLGPVLPPPGSDHPASPEAADAPVPSRMSALDVDASELIEDEGAPAAPSYADHGDVMEHQHSMESMEDGEPLARAEPASQDRRLYEGIGVIIAVLPGKSRMVINHADIKDFMAAMEMSYMVSPATLLQGLNPGDKVRFTIDADKRAIVDVSRLEDKE